MPSIYCAADINAMAIVEPDINEQVAIITDVHGNLESLTEVLKAIKDKGIIRIWCLGDIMGYAPDAVACAYLVKDNCELVLAGNHDLAVLNKISARDFNGMAGQGITHAKTELAKNNDPDLLAWLESLEPKAVVGKIGLFHGSPVDPVWHYVFTENDALRAFLRLDDELAVCLVGHSHFQLAFIEDQLNARPQRQGPNHGIMEESVTALAPKRLLINPGSTGQPRNGNQINPLDARVSFGILTRLENGYKMQWEHVAYNIDKTMARVKTTPGLSELIGSRLYPRQGQNQL